MTLVIIRYSAIVFQSGSRTHLGGVPLGPVSTGRASCRAPSTPKATPPPYVLTRVESPAEVVFYVRGEDVEKVELKPLHYRGVERALIGLSAEDVPAYVSRICGICPIAHQIASSQAIEASLGIDSPPETASIVRKLALIAEHVKSHTLHLFLHTLPDLFSYAYNSPQDVFTISRAEREYPRKIGALIAFSNRALAELGGRGVISMVSTVGGVYSRLTSSSRERIEKELKQAKAAISWAKDLLYSRRLLDEAMVDRELYDLPEGTMFITTASGGELWGEAKMYAGRKPKPILIADLLGGSYYEKAVLTGPAARHVARGGEVHEAMNLLTHIRIRMDEIESYLDAAERLLNEPRLYHGMLRERVKAADSQGTSAVEAPRGTLVHYYRVERGAIAESKIVTPTMLNRGIMITVANRLVRLASDLAFPRDYIISKAMAAIRLFDPCISCLYHTIK